jgi:hypothetical protein
MLVRRPAMTVLVALCVALAALVCATAQAGAAVTHKYLTSIAEEVPVAGPHGETIPSPGPMSAISALTLDSGELYVTDLDSRIDRFDASTGGFLSQLAKVPSSLFDVRQGVAVGHSTGETEAYVAGDENTAGGIVGVVAAFGADGSLQAVWHGEDTPSGDFVCYECGDYRQSNVAVDNSTNPFTAGDVYVIDEARGVVDVFEPKADGGERYLTQLTGPEPGVLFQQPGPRGVAVDQANGDVVVVDGSDVDVFEPTALNQYVLTHRLTGAPSGSFEYVNAVAVDSGDGDIYVVEGERGVVDQFDSAGSYLGHITGSAVPGGKLGSMTAAAVDSSTHELYVSTSHEQAQFVDVFGPSVVIPDVVSQSPSEVKGTSATLNGTVDPDEAGQASCRFEWGTSPALEKAAACEPEAVANGSSPVAVHAALGGLTPDTVYYYRLQASNGNGTNPGEEAQTQQFKTPGPGVQEEAVATVTAGSATLSARIDPNGSETLYYFQYGEGGGYEASVPAQPGAALGSGEGYVPVSVHLQGLAPAATYHYRVVATSRPGGETIVEEGSDRVFVTQSAGVEVAQPDGRRWEMVSPPNKHGASIKPIGSEGGADVQAAADGGRITYTASAPIAVDPAGSRSIEETQAFSSRTAAGSWETADISTAHDEGATPAAVGHSAEYKLFSTDLSLGFVEPAGCTPLPPLAPSAESSVYLRKLSGEYEALVTAANVPQGTKFGKAGVSCENGNGAVQFAGASPDLSHVVLESDVKLTAAPSPPGEPQYELYEWSGGQLQLASVLPDEAPTGASLGQRGNVVRNAVSSNGERIVFKPSGSESGHLDLRDMASGETVEVDAAQGAPEPQGQDVSLYATASSDDSRVFFTSPARLTAAATVASEEQENLYVFEVTSAAGQPLAGRLTDLTVAANAGEAAGVRGVIGASEDGSYVYFVARNVLGDGAQHGAVANADNLYLVRYDDATRAWQAPQFIAALANGDRNDWEASEKLNEVTSRVAPNGRYLTFMSEASLTGYDNRDANSAVPDEEVFLYDAASGRTVCASCNPTGARPVGLHEGEETLENLVDWQKLWRDRWIAANVPGWTNKDLSSAVYQSRYLDSSGRLFFDSSDALVPADVNGQEDVYEYEPLGVGGCQGAASQNADFVYEEGVGGCVGLISAGTSSEESAFLDASESGGDVFFLTLSQLSPADYDTGLDIYDAHECTAAAPCAAPVPLTPPPCTTGDACKPAPTPQPTLFGAPASQTFSGAGNVVPAAPAAHSTVKSKGTSGAQKLARALKACRKQTQPKRARCERQARRRARGAGTRENKRTVAAGARRTSRKGRS